MGTVGLYGVGVNNVDMDRVGEGDMGVYGEDMVGLIGLAVGITEIGIFSRLYYVWIECYVYCVLGLPSPNTCLSI